MKGIVDAPLSGESDGRMGSRADIAVLPRTSYPLRARSRADAEARTAVR